MVCGSLLAWQRQWGHCLLSRAIWVTATCQLSRGDRSLTSAQAVVELIARLKEPTHYTQGLTTRLTEPPPSLLTQQCQRAHYLPEKTHHTGSLLTCQCSPTNHPLRRFCMPARLAQHFNSALLTFSQLKHFGLMTNDPLMWWKTVLGIATCSIVGFFVVRALHQSTSR